MQNYLFIYDLRNFMMPDISSLCAFQLAVTYNNPLNVNEWTKIYIEHRTVCVSNLFHPGIGHNPGQAFLGRHREELYLTDDLISKLGEVYWSSKL